MTNKKRPGKREREAFRAQRQQLDERGAIIEKAGRENDRALLKTLGSAEQYQWHEARRSVDPQHENPYKPRRS